MTVVNNVNITNVYRNARVNNGVTAVSGTDFASGRFNNVVKLSDNDMHPFAAAISNMEELDLASGVRDVYLAPEQLAAFNTIASLDGSRAAFSINAQ